MKIKFLGYIDVAICSFIHGGTGPPDHIGYDLAHRNRRNKSEHGLPR